MTRTEKLNLLQEKVAACQKCSALCSRRNIVFGEGNPASPIVFMGEAPGEEEDQTGRPFVGRSGKLLRLIIERLGWREQDVYILNILKCRPPGNRKPTVEEAANCEQYLKLQLAIIRPQYIICWGATAAYFLLKPDCMFSQFSISSYRCRLFEYEGAKVLCTYHPSYLLRNPAAKPQVWADLQFFLQETGFQMPQLS